MDVLIDLDGTLVDPAAGIIASFQAGLRSIGHPVPPAKDLHWIIGPPLRQSIPQLGVAAGDVDLVLEAYRVAYRAGAMFEARPYDGIDATLTALRDAGHRLIVATSKPHVFARPILEHFDLARHFSAIHGSELDGRNDDKAELIAHIIATERVDTTRAVMIGDRKFDGLGAGKNAMRWIGVLWGYGSSDELRDAGAADLANDPTELVELVTALRK